MATKVLVNGKFETRPGSYATIKSGVKNPAPAQPYGNILIIDDGIGAGFGGGSGINGTLQNGVNSIYEFTSKEEFQAFTKGGELWNLANPLFKPNPSKNFPGVSKIYLAQARSTTPATISVELENGSFDLTPKDEGVNANGVLTGQILTGGYAGKFERKNIPANNATFVTTTTQAPGTEIKATATIDVATVRVDGDIFSVVLADDTVLGTYTKITGDSTLTAVGTKIKNAINTGTGSHGFTATNVAGAITITAPTGSGSTLNSTSVYLNVLVLASSDTEVDDTGTFTGGIPALPKINQAVASNINVGDIFTVVAAGVTKTVTASSSLPANLYNQFATLLNANSTVSAEMTVSVSPTGLLFTGVTVNTSFTQTSSVTAAAPQFVFQIFHGMYKGLDPMNNIPYDNILAADTVALKVIESPVFTQISDLITWFNTSGDFGYGFILNEGSVATGAMTVNDLATYPGYILAAGGTENYGSTDLDSVIDKINNLDFVHILATKYGTEATGVNNTKLFDFITDKSKYDRLLVVAGGYDINSFKYGSGSSTVTAAYYNSDEVIVIHGGAKKKFRNANGFVTYSQLYKAAAILGRVCGLEPQVPVTLKSIGIDGEVHLLDDKEQEFAIANGIMYSYYDTEFEAHVAGLDITSLLKNEFLINDDGTTYNWALKRIEADLNKTIIVDGKKRFFGDEAGGNRNTTAVEEVTVWLKGKLESLTASDKKDNLIISFEDVAASIEQDNIHTSYKFVGNTEISKMVSTGTIIYK